MKQPSSAACHPRRFAALLLFFAALVACQGRGRVHEAPPAEYPDDAPAPFQPAPVPPPADEGSDPTDGVYAEPPAASDVPGATTAPKREFERAERADAEKDMAESPGDAPSESPAAARSENSADARSSTSLGSGRASAPSAKPSWDDAPRRPLSPRDGAERRPGLATHWGETRYSPARQVDFERRDGGRPSATLELHYNDRSGAGRMLPNGRWGRAEAGALDGLRVRLVDAAGHTLPALMNGSRVIGVGAPGERYALEIENTTGARFEVVASVDGLDVLDGEDASFEKRGYLIGAYASVSIDGFRRSDAEVAAFRLGDVARSYAASKGKARNVGVIGFAFFEERRRALEEPLPIRRPRSADDTELRRNADPFPGRYARPPVW